MRYPRSYLFVPGDRPERFDKACASGAGLVVIDLEDAVAPQNKQAARAAIAGWLRPDRAVALRINAAGTQWFEEDMALCTQAQVAGVMLPKAEDAETLGLLASRLPRAALLPIIETARGMADSLAVASCAGVQRLIFGSIDFQLDLGIEGDAEELLFFRSQLVLTSALARIAAPVDGICTSLEDLQSLRTETLRARRLGFGAKLCIHPKQVATVNDAFAPTDEEIAWARRIVAAAEASQGGAVAVDGRMVDKPIILRAQALLDGS